MDAWKMKRPFGAFGAYFQRRKLAVSFREGKDKIHSVFSPRLKNWCWLTFGNPSFSSTLIEIKFMWTWLVQFMRNPWDSDQTPKRQVRRKLLLRTLAVLWILSGQSSTSPSCVSGRVVRATHNKCHVAPRRNPPNPGVGLSRYYLE